MHNLASIGDQEQFHNIILKSIDKISEAIVVLDKNGKIIFVNNAVELLIKHSKNQLIGSQITGPQFKVKTLDGALMNFEESPFFQAIKKGKSKSNIEIIAERSDRVDISISLNLVPLKINSKVNYLVASFTKITKTKKTVNELKASEERYKHLVQDSPDAIVVYGKGKILFVNPAAVSIIKAKNQTELIGKSIMSFVHPKYRELVAERIEKMIITGKASPLMEEIFIRLDGNYIDVEVAASPIVYEGTEAIQVIFRDISERKKNEKSLREYKQYFSQMLEKIKMIALIIDTKGYITFANDYLLEITGWKRQEIIGKNWFDLFIPEKNKLIIQQVFFSLMAGESLPTNYENEILTKNGDKLTISFTNLVIKDIDQNAVSVASIGQDVTERRKIDNELRESEERFRLIFEHAPISIALVNLERKFIAVNPFVGKMFNYKTEELVGTNPNNITYPEDRDRDRELFCELSQGKRPYYKIEKRYITKDGRIIWGYLTNTIVRDADGRPLYALASVEDITDRKKHEEELKEREQQFRTVVETTEDAIIVCKDSKVIYWNNSAQSIFGYKTKEVIGKPISMLMPDKELIDRHNNGLERYIKTGKSKIIGKKPYETYAKRKDGTTIPVELSLARNYFEKGISFIGIIREITEQKKIKDELAVSKQQYNVVLETATDAIIQCKNGMVTYWNKSAEKVFNYKAKEIMGKPVISLMPERFIEDHQKGVDKVTLTGKSNIVGKKTYEISGKRKDGSEVPLELSVAKNTINNEVFFTGILRNITERKKAEKQLQSAYETADKIAYTLQKSLLPSEIPKIEGLEIKFYYQATGEGEVGGDFYDVFKTTADTYGIIVGDVSGKGVEVAAETARVKYLLRDRAFDGSAPSKVMQMVNDSLVKQNITHFTALTYALYDPVNSNLEIVNAGNPFPYLVKEDKFFEIRGMPVSLFPKQKYISTCLKMNKGDSLLIFSDGIVETRRRKELFGENRIKEFVMKNKNMTLDNLLKNLVEKARKFSENNLRDDILVVGIKKL